MKRVLQVVSLALIAALLALPAAALASCWQMDATHDECPDGCPMMAAMQSPDTTMSAQPQGQSCCEISEGRPASSSELQVPSAPTVVAASQTAAAAVFEAISPLTPKPPLSQSHSGESCSPQAVLCTFLI